MRYLLDLCVNKSVTVVIEKKIRRFKMLRHNDVFIIDIQEQGIEAKNANLAEDSCFYEFWPPARFTCS